MCILCEIRKKIERSQDIHANAGRRYAIKLQEFALLLDENKAREAEPFRMELHTLLDVQLDALASSSKDVRQFKVEVEKFNKGGFHGRRY